MPVVDDCILECGNPFFLEHFELIGVTTRGTMQLRIKIVPRHVICNRRFWCCIMSVQVTPCEPIVLWRVFYSAFYNVILDEICTTATQFLAR